MTHPGCKKWRRTRKIGAILAAMALAALLLPCAYADVKVEGWREQSLDYAITNINDFPDYVFLTSSVIWGWEYASVLNSTGSFGEATSWTASMFMPFGLQTLIKRDSSA